MDERQLLFTEFFNHKLKERGLTLEELSEMSGINLKHLELLSHGRFEQLPPTPYLYGYFRRLGQILGFDYEDWWSRIKGEGVVKTSGKGDLMAKNRYARRRKGIWFVLAIVLLLAGFFASRAPKILGEPQIDLTYPPASQTKAFEDHIIFEGKISNADELTIMDQQIPHEDDGFFRTEVPLQPGANKIEVKAKKILGRETKITREIYYDASESFIPRPGEASSTNSTTTP